MATNTVDFASWNFSNVQLAPAKLKLVDAQSLIVMTAALAAEAATRAAADTAEATIRGNADIAEAAIRGNADLVLQSNIDAANDSYAHSLLLGGM